MPEELAHHQAAQQEIPMPEELAPPQNTLQEIPVAEEKTPPRPALQQGNDFVRDIDDFPPFDKAKEIM
ncbi:hypothetical protein TanjilG_15201 [Lupinus angustifolius]|uniref:Uncharacterized protein n=1 Tax=Lupinus angustifolius TaxID=3871 RepID=A0A1J7H5T9_LUPAN|nr:hypothetical protein TanjilG_15201 [Lupinus angustifolius]